MLFRRLSMFCLVLLAGCGKQHVVSVDGGITPPPLLDGAGYCFTNSDCPASMVCDVHSCYGGSGVCRSRPASCPSIWAPVCGCNHQTYSSDCHRLAAGQPLKYQGVCAAVVDGGYPPPPPPPLQDAAVPAVCYSGGKCPAGMVCNLKSCYPGASGQCVTKPPSCPSAWSPVCGCDGVTYTNDCFRLSYGTSLAHPGTCSTSIPDQGVVWPPDIGVPWLCPPGVIKCQTNYDCPTGSYCITGCCTGSLPPPPVDAGYPPDAPIPPPLGCGPFPGGQCPSKMVCNITSCYPGAYGKCVSKPAACPSLWSPSCGCDGVTYTNDCYRLFYGASLAHPGSCAAPVLDQGIVWPDAGWPWP